MIIDLKTQELTTVNQRLKKIRSFLKISRAYIQEKYALPEVTLKSWENGTTPLSFTGAMRCVDVYRAEGLIVSVDWLMEGVGFDPKTTATVSQYFATPTHDASLLENDEIAMMRDANYFKESHPHAVVMLVSNDDMRPFYWPGDYIGGKMRYTSEIESSVNKDCMIYAKNGERFFRRLIKNSDGGYNLVCLNPNKTTSEPVLYDVKIDGVAPVIWHRRKDD